jgi:hypothetical protein
MTVVDDIVYEVQAQVRWRWLCRAVPSGGGSRWAVGGGGEGR